MGTKSHFHVPVTSIPPWEAEIWGFCMFAVHPFRSAAAAGSAVITTKTPEATAVKVPAAKVAMSLLRRRVIAGDPFMRGEYEQAATRTVRRPVPSVNRHEAITRAVRWEFPASWGIVMGRANEAIPS